MYVFIALCASTRDFQHPKISFTVSVTGHTVCNTVVYLLHGGSKDGSFLSDH